MTFKYKSHKAMMDDLADMSHQDKVNLLTANGFRVTAIKFGFIAQKGLQTIKCRTIYDLLLTTKTIGYEKEHVTA